MNSRYTENTFTTIEDYEEHLTQWKMTCLRVSEGPFSANLQSLELPTLSLIKRVASCGIIHHSRSMTDRFYLMLPQSRMPHLINGVPVSVGEMYVSLGRQQTASSFIPENACSRWLFFTEEGLERYFSANEQLGLREFFQKQLKFNGQKVNIRRFANQLPVLAEFAAQQELSMSLDVELVETAVFSELWRILETLNPKHTLKLSIKTRRRVVSRAIDYIVTHPAGRASVAGMCDSAFCSVRTLQYAFRTVLQCSPQRFLRLWVFHAVRKDLLAHKHACVSCCMKAFNITNQSRFSKEYQALFGEPPLATLGSPESLSGD